MNERNLYREKIIELKQSGIILYKDIALATGINHGQLSRFINQGGSLSDEYFEKVKEYVDGFDIEGSLSNSEVAAKVEKFVADSKIKMNPVPYTMIHRTVGIQFKRFNSWRNGNAKLTQEELEKIEKLIEDLGKLLNIY